MRKSMVEKGLVPDWYTYVTFVNGYCREKRLREAKLILSEMNDVGLKLGLIGYRALIDGFVKRVDVEEALGIKGEMVTRGIQIDMALSVGRSPTGKYLFRGNDFEGFETECHYLYKSKFS
ncbi:hypothetical protein FH972_010641 [Carpinus fangiana]|uniref:Pentacotripeptide-repeat region of PRORP domain-containing protein n=1 Tax=Carpinus fangiana TaxID=176857 RepID=A0A660KUY0_9ROSI|nr:hypothetical protein FH972_010641 [Carpinus fangiana]